MDDDEYNVVGTYGGDEPMTYPSDEISDENNSTLAMSRLNDMGGRIAKRMRDQLDSVPDDNIYVHPIDWHMRMDCGTGEREAKRAKQESDNAVIDRLTSRILQARQRRAEKIWKNDKINDDDMIDEDDEDYGQLIMERPPVDGSPWIGISSQDCHDRMYVRLFRSRRAINNLANYTNVRDKSMSAFPTDKLVAEAKQLRDDRSMEKESNLIDNERMYMMETTDIDDGLWVNKYAPTNYTDLLSPDSLNRQVLQWLRLWDECVFGRKVRDDVIQSGMDEKESILYGMDGGNPRRPHFKILVLAGSAGLGKTTLVGVTARLAGYSVVETNASDSRNVGDLEKIIEGAMRSTRTLDGDRRPMCIVLDEIDGAPIDTIKWLIKTIGANDRKKMRRPIIAICNNLYTPALRELRPVSLIVNMIQTKPARMIERLSQIIGNENMRVDRAALECLTRLTQCDIRLSLNILQYLSMASHSNNTTLTVSEVERAMEKARPHSSNIFAHWSTVLDFSKHLDRKGLLLPLSDRLSNVERVAIEEDTDRLIMGIHHNYTSINNLTTNTLTSASRIFSTLDTFNTLVHATKNFSLSKYINPCFLSLHITIATHSKATLQYPSHAQNVQLRRKQSEDTLTHVRCSLSSYCSCNELIKDTLPLIISILQPPIKTMNASLMSRQDKILTINIVKGLISYGLSFSPHIVDGTVNYIFSPPVDVLTMYSVSKANRKMLPNNIRKALAHEVLLSSVRHSLTPHPSIPFASLSTTVSSKPSRPTPTACLQPPSYNTQKNVPLHFKYNNCFSNAVKRNVKMMQLIS